MLWIYPEPLDNPSAPFRTASYDVAGPQQGPASDLQVGGARQSFRRFAVHSAFPKVVAIHFDDQRKLQLRGCHRAAQSQPAHSFVQHIAILQQLATSLPE